MYTQNVMEESVVASLDFRQSTRIGSGKYKHYIELPQWLSVIAGSISMRHVCCMEIQMFQKICITFSFLARAVDQLDR